jgi:GntR family transcriptional regulator
LITASEVETELRRRIDSGEFRPGDRLPKLNELMQTYGVRSRSAMDRVLRTLAAEGRLTIRQGSGIYVSQRHVVHRNLVRNIQLEHERAIRDEVADEGLFEAMTGTDHVNVDTSYELINADERVAARLQIEKGSPLLMRIFRYTIAEVPHQITRSYMTADLAQAAGLTSPACERPGVGTMMQLRHAGAAPDRVRVWLEGRNPTPAEREQLAIGPGTPVIELWRTMSRGGTPVEVCGSIVPSDRVGYEIDVELKDLT